MSFHGAVLALLLTRARRCGAGGIGEVHVVIVSEISGGVGSIAVRLSRALAASGLRVTLVTDRPGVIDMGVSTVEADFPSIRYRRDSRQSRVVSLLRAGSVSFRMTKKLGSVLSNLHDRQKIDVVHLNSLRATLWGTRWAKVHGVPVVWHIHEWQPTAWRRCARSMLALLGANAVIAVSNEVAAPFKRLPILRKRVEVIPNGIVLDKALWLSRQYGFVVAYLGRLTKEKGLHIFLDVAESIAMSGRSKWSFKVAGDLATLDDEYVYRRLYRLVESGIVSYVGYVNEPMKFLSSVDVVIQPSQEFDAWPTVLLEAMGSGCCVIGTDSGGISELIADGENGYVVEKENATRRIVEKLAYLEQHVNVLRMMQRNSFLRAGRFSFREQVDRTIQVYRSVIAFGRSCT